MRFFFILFFAGQAFAQSQSWQIEYTSEACGQSVQAARYNAFQIATDTAVKYEITCRKQEGEFRVIQRDCYCSPYEPSDPSCPVICNVCSEVNCVL